MSEAVPLSNNTYRYETAGTPSAVAVATVTLPSGTTTPSVSGSGTSDDPWLITLEPEAIPMSDVGKTGKVAWDYSTEEGGVTHDEEPLEIVPYYEPHYGSFVKASGRLPYPLTMMSAPNLSDVYDELVAESDVLNARLAAAGFETPATDPDDIRRLDRAVELLASANILERMLIAADPTAQRIETAQSWRRQGKEIIDAIVAGVMKQDRGPTSGAGFASTAGAFTDEQTTDFVEAFGDG